MINLKAPIDFKAPLFTVWKSEVMPTEISEVLIQHLVCWEIWGYSYYRKTIEVGFPPIYKYKRSGIFSSKQIAKDSITNIHKFNFFSKELIKLCEEEEWEVFGVMKGEERTSSWCLPPKGVIQILLNEEQDIILAHEMGHLMAYKLSMDSSDEELAWQLGEEIWKGVFKTPPPKRFYNCKTRSLATYGIIG